MHDAIMVGAGIGGLNLALTLYRAGIACRLYEAADEIRPAGVGVNLLPHAVRGLTELGLQEALVRVAVATQEAVFFNRFGQLIYRDALGRLAGFEWPQFSIHRGDLQAVLLEAFKAPVGSNRLQPGWRCTGADQDDDGVSVHFRRVADDAALPDQGGAIVIACDGIHCVIRKQRYPGEGDPELVALSDGYKRISGSSKEAPAR